MEKRPSMKRRADFNDYLDRGIYMITISIEGRRPLLGTLAGNVLITTNDALAGNANTTRDDALTTSEDDKPHVILSPLGKKVKECWDNIRTYYPQVEPRNLAIMPDHIHGILFVHERIDKHLGHIINGFKAGTRKAARELGIDLSSHYPTSSPGHSSVAPSSGNSSIAPSSPDTPAVQYTEALPQSAPHPNTHKHPKRGTLWEPNYHDRLLLHKGQLQRMIAYINDNPRRLLLKRTYPQFFSNITTVTAAGMHMQAMGNLALLHHPNKLQVQCSRHLYPQEIEQRKQHFLEQGRQGAVLVSPCISPGESAITTAAMQQNIPLIVLLLKGFPPFFKPHPRYLEACAAGRLLLLAPYPWQNEKLEKMRDRCLNLNDIATRICLLYREKTKA
ncbi:MAG: hypothetical protein IJ637_03115 [Prevotella sp.]|nr:hypothetical protein [Prevotella sp.]